MMTAFVPSLPPVSGLLCPKCQQPSAAVLGSVTSFVVTFQCQSQTCGFQWVSMHPEFVVRPNQKTDKERP
jgi:hypothetical protein